MLIKSISHTSPSASIKRLIDYIFGADKERYDAEGNEVTVSKLLHGERHMWTEQFDRVEQRRTSHYGGKEVKFYHEILSFSPESKPTHQELDDLIRTYISLRTDKPTLVFGAVHFDTIHIHAHICIQGIDMYGKSIRKSKHDFNVHVQQKLEQYQQEKYPHLSHSIIDYSKSSKNRTPLESHSSRQRKKRTKEQSQKEQLAPIIEQAFITAHSPEAFAADLLKEGIECYYRSGKLTGVCFNNRKWRLKHTLGVDFQKLLKPSMREERIKRLQNITNSEQHKTQDR